MGHEYEDLAADGALPIVHTWPFVLVQGLAFAAAGYGLRACSERRGRRRRQAVATMAKVHSWGTPGPAAYS